MPELPDVESFKKYFDKNAVGKEIEKVEVLENRLVKGISGKKFREAFRKETFKKSERYGKWLIASTSKGKKLAMHFGMTGKLVHTEKNKQRPPYSRIEFDFKDQEKIFFSDRRKIGGLEVVDSKEELIQKHDLGPDALEIKQSDFLQRLENKRGKIKLVLMDQSVLAGIGNVYADEILFQSGIHPESSVNTLTEKELKTIFKNIKPVLETAIQHQSKRKSLPQNYLLPHRKEGEDCPHCSGKVKKIKVGGRTTFFCPSCQSQK